VTEIIAHRGTPREFPENTVLGFLRALELGADGVELDVHGTGDGVAVVHHDPVLGAGHGRPGAAIRQMTYAEVRGYPLADGTAVPTLVEVLLAIGGRATVYVETKAHDIERSVVACIAQAGATGWCAIHSFDHRASRHVRAIAPSMPTGILVSSYLIDPARALRAAGARDYWQQWEEIDDALVLAVHEAGGRVVAWTVNDSQQGARLAALGVDALCTDVCKEFRAK